MTEAELQPAEIREGKSRRNVILAIIIFALVLRLVGLDHGLPYIYSDGESSFVLRALKMLDRRDLNPHWFGHPGSTVMYAQAAVLGVVLAGYYPICRVTGRVADMDGYKELLHHDMTVTYFSTRLITVFCAIVTLIFLYRLTRRRFNQRTAWIATLLVAVAPYHVMYSRAARTDIPATMFAVMAVCLLLEFVDTGRKRTLWLASFLAGAGIATKYPMVAVVVPIALAAVMADWRRRRERGESRWGLLGYRALVLRVLVFVFVGFFVCAPYAVLDWQETLDSVRHENRAPQAGQQHATGLAKHWWYLSTALPRGMGWSLPVILAAGGAVSAVRRQGWSAILLLLFPVLFVVGIGLPHLRWAHWIIPVIPFCAAFAGTALDRIIERLLQMRRLQAGRRAVYVAMVLVVGVSLPGCVKSVRKAIVLTRRDTRELAKVWLEGEAAQGAAVAFDWDGPQMQLAPREDLALVRRTYVNVVDRPLTVYDELGVDYIMLNGDRRDAFLSDADRFPVEVRRYRRIAAEWRLVHRVENCGRPGPVVDIYARGDAR